jgi:hypothetical protein
MTGLDDDPAILSQSRQDGADLLFRVFSGITQAFSHKRPLVDSNGDLRVP